MPKVKNNTRKKTKFVPYVKGFKLPTVSQRKSALGNGRLALKREFSEGEGAFESVPKCTSVDDWLAQYKEDGQTFLEFKEQCPWLSKRKRKFMKQTFVTDGTNLKEKYPSGKIYILPLGDFTADSSPDFDALVEYAETFLCLPVKALPPVKLEYKEKGVYWVHERSDGSESKELINSRHHDGKRQIKVDAGLLKLKAYMPEDAICMIALTMCDLFETKPDLFVAGMAAGSARVAIFSLYRYDPNLNFSREFWYEVKQKKICGPDEQKKLILERSCRLLVHEINHLLGIDHCIFYACCMNGSGHLDEDFKQPMFLCPVDLKKLHLLCDFDIVERYKKLQTFFSKHNMRNHAEWIEKRCDFITNKK